MKQIKIVESNNVNLDSLQNLNVKSIEDASLIKLRDYVLSKIRLTDYKDPQIFFETMDWVSSQWAHDGLHEAPDDMASYEILQKVEEGEQFRCVEYAKVTADLLNSLGYATRSLNIKSKDSDYGGFGRAHMVTEVWSNVLDKWVFLDPQCSIYAEHHGQPLNYYEIYHRFEDVEFRAMGRKLAQLGVSSTEIIEDYKKFISDYFGFMKINVDADGITAGLTLHLDQPEQQLAFQAMELNHAIFTNRVEDLYFSPNHTLLLFDYKKKVPFEKIMKEHKDHLQKEEDLKANLHLFAAEPDFIVRLQNNMTWFSHYEIQIDDGEIFSSNQSSLDWKLTEGMNSIRVCAVNSQGVKGVPTEMKISYQ